MSEPAKDNGVRVKVAFSCFRVGQVIFPPGVQRSNLLSSGFVEVVKADELRKKKASREG